MNESCPRCQCVCVCVCACERESTRERVCVCTRSRVRLGAVLRIMSISAYLHECLYKHHTNRNLCKFIHTNMCTHMHTHAGNRHTYTQLIRICECLCMDANSLARVCKRHIHTHSAIETYSHNPTALQKQIRF